MMTPNRKALDVKELQSSQAFASNGETKDRPGIHKEIGHIPRRPVHFRYHLCKLACK
jgi:hypothetical protein